MTEVHVHGIVAVAERPSGDVRTVACGDVAAIVSDASAGGRAASLVRAHWRLLERVAAETTVLPVRFGTAMADDAAVVREFLEPEHDRLAARLAELAGKVQLTVKGTYDERSLLSGVLERSPEVAQLQQKVRALPEDASYYQRIELGQLISNEVERLREVDAELVVGRLAPLAISSRREAPATLDGAVNAAFLVERAAIGAFTAGTDRLAAELNGRMRLRCIGPLPPYSFTDSESATETASWA